MVIVTVQISTPPPPLAEPSHCVTESTGVAEVDGVVVQVPAPAPIGPAAPTHFVTLIVDGAEAAPLLVTKLSIVTVQERPCPPTLLAVSLLHWFTGALSCAALIWPPLPASAPITRRHIARMLAILRTALDLTICAAVHFEHATFPPRP